MKTFNQQAAQGDILITRINKLPTGLKEEKTENEQHIIAHSETGHHHVVDAERAHFYRNEQNPMICYLVVTDSTELIHMRSFDNHEPIQFSPGVFEIRRQREYNPMGWRPVMD